METKNHKVILRSELYGNAYYSYDTVEKQLAAAQRLLASATKIYEKDGIDREVVLVIGLGTGNRIALSWNQYLS
jgi:hypothetical protein